MRIVIVLALVARVAFADPAGQAKADALFEKGQTAYQAGSYKDAIELFKQAYELVRDPVYLFNIAQSYRKVLDCENASDYYNRYLTESPNAVNKAKVQQWLRELAPCVEERQKEHETAKRAEELERQRRNDEANRRPPAIVQPVATEVDTGGTYRIAGIAVGSVGAVGLVIGIVEGIRGTNIKNDLANRCALTNGGCNWDAPDIQQRHNDGQRANTFAYVGYIGGGIAALAGAGLYVWGRTKVETVMVAPTAGGASASVTIRY